VISAALLIFPTVKSLPIPLNAHIAIPNRSTEATPEFWGSERSQAKQATPPKCVINAVELAVSLKLRSIDFGRGGSS